MTLPFDTRRSTVAPRTVFAFAIASSRLSKAANCMVKSSSLMAAGRTGASPLSSKINRTRAVPGPII